jgi:ABC-2 type transport system permease protein
MNFAALRAFLVKEMRHILRDRQTLTILLAMPLVQVVLFGFALRSDVRNVRVAFVVPAPDVATRGLISRFHATDRFDVILESPRSSDAEMLFRRGDADVAVMLEPDFASHITGGDTAHALVVVDASDPNTGTVIRNYVRAVIVAWQSEVGAKPGGANIVIDTRMRFNQSLESVNLFVPGLIALVLTLVSALMTAISLSREKERGTLEVLLVSPLRPWHIIIGKVLPYLGLAFANVLTALLAAWLVFHVPFRGSILLLMAESILYAIVSLALGVLIAARTNSQRGAMLAAMLGTLLPSTLLSGMIFPIASMPRWLSPVTNIVPARWFIVVARGIMLKGVGLEYLWRETMILSFMALVLIAAAVKSFKPRMA